MTADTRQKAVEMATIKFPKWSDYFVENVTEQEVACSCLYDQNGVVEMYCDLCMYGPKRTAYYANRSYARSACASATIRIIQEAFETKDAEHILTVLTAADAQRESHTHCVEIVRIVILRFICAFMEELDKESSVYPRFVSMRKKFTEWKEMEDD